MSSEQVEGFMEPRMASAALGILPKRPSVLERLMHERNQITERLEQVNDAIGALEANPEVSRVIEIVSKVTGF